MVGAPFGVLTYFEIPVDVQVAFLVASLALLSVSSTVLFESWFHKFISSQIWKKARILWIALHYCSLPVLVWIAMEQAPEQDRAKDMFLELLPRIPSGFNTNHIFVLTQNSLAIVIAFTTLILILIAESLFFTMLTLLFSSENPRVSQETLRKQSGFLGKLHLQVLIPILTLIFSVAYGIISSCLGYYNQVLNNLFVSSAGFHGILSSIVLIFMYEDYRKLFRRNTVKQSPGNEMAFERRNSGVVTN
ncbi:hypothetical protein L3Y34_006709 [Caenorhabditis briggsae]|uniref:Uncharacterized protein n=1 Tax=Caenorhabditis briggsae TaxID=6238 RepID=A0AAE9A0F5_CAEBR|nr:hypothetical protein L3Y34_006709 [Caenorhabditis briggsae]